MLVQFTIEYSLTAEHRFRRDSVFLVPMHGGIWTLCIDLPMQQLQELRRNPKFPRGAPPCVNYLAGSMENARGEEQRNDWQHSESQVITLQPHLSTYYGAILRLREYIVFKSDSPSPPPHTHSSFLSSIYNCFLLLFFWAVFPFINYSIFNSFTFLFSISKNIILCTLHLALIVIVILQTYRRCLFR